MEVKDFSKEIGLAANENSRGKYLEVNKAGGATTFFASMLASTFGTFEMFGNPIYHLSGGLTYLVNKIADKRSTIKTLKLFEDPRFTEYGFEKHWQETSPIYSKHPSKKEILFSKKALTSDILFGIASVIFPPVGHGSIAASPFIYANNRWIVKDEIEKAFQIGDEVKEMIEKGLSKEEVNLYLESLIKGGKDDERRKP